MAADCCGAGEKAAPGCWQCGQGESPLQLPLWLQGSGGTGTPWLRVLTGHHGQWAPTAFQDGDKAQAPLGQSKSTEMLKRIMWRKLM